MQDHTCALMSDGGLFCWGHNLNGQVITLLICSRAGFAVAALCTCAVHTSLSTTLQVGINTNGSPQNTPVQVSIQSLSVSAGGVSLSSAHEMCTFTTSRFSLLQLREPCPGCSLSTMFLSLSHCVFFAACRLSGQRSSRFECSITPVPSTRLGKCSVGERMTIGR